MGNTGLDRVLEEIMQNLKEAFVSEADFQFYLAWELKNKLSDNYEIMLEYPIQNGAEKWHIDIAVKNKKTEAMSFIELKYKTIKSEITRHGKKIELAQQSAQDMGRYWFIKDINRLEEQNGGGENNFCIFLTNDQGYWKAPNNIETLDKNFRLHGRLIQKGDCSWNKKENKKHWTDDYPKIHLNQEHPLEWHKCQTQQNQDLKNFRYLLLKVPHK